MLHLHVQLLARYVTFGKSLLLNDALEVRFIVVTQDMSVLLMQAWLKGHSSLNQYEA